MIGNQIKEKLEQISPSQEITVNHYEGVELTIEETEAALTLAKQEKLRRLKIEEWNEKISSNPVWTVPTAEMMFKALLQTKSKTGRNFELTEWNTKTIKQLCLYFVDDQRFEGDLKKGIMLMGNPGSGKTHLMNFFSKNPKASYSLPTCKQLSQWYMNGWTTNDMSVIEVYSVLKNASAGHQWDQKVLGYCFGDLGSEEDAKHYGNHRNVIEEIVFARYENNTPFHYTHFTTNLNAPELQTRYGERFRDRAKEMCNTFTLNGTSFR
jgi:ATPase subunit of ABC transporter with duplicated ATPase domains